MPLSVKGREIKKAMVEHYGQAKGDRVFYASENAGKISGVTTKPKVTTRYAKRGR